MISAELIRKCLDGSAREILSEDVAFAFIKFVSRFVENIRPIPLVDHTKWLGHSATASIGGTANANDFFIEYAERIG